MIMLLVFILLTSNGSMALSKTNNTTMVTPLNSNGNSYEPSISDDGKWITYESDATNLVENDTNGKYDIFLYDVVNNITTMINPLNSNGYSYKPSISGDGKWITYNSDANNIVENDTNGNTDVFLYDVVNNITTMINPLNSNSYSEYPSISGDGKWITYSSYASNLVDGDTNGNTDVFLYDVVNNITTMINPLNSNSYSYEPSISGDGKWITYSSYASNIVENDTNGNTDVFLYDVVNNITTMVTPLNSNGGSYSPSISGDGKWITYYSFVSNIVDGDTNGNTDVFLYDVVNNITTMITPLNSNSGSYYPSISGDGKWITYYSSASNIVENDTNGVRDVFLYDVVNNITTMINPLNSNEDSENPVISGDGKWITYSSYASNLVDGDTNGKYDVFLFGRYVEENNTTTPPTEQNNTTTPPTEQNNTTTPPTDVNNTTVGDIGDKNDTVVKALDNLKETGLPFQYITIILAILALITIYKRK